MNSDTNQYSLRDLLRSLSRRRSVVVWTAATVLLAAIVACVFMTRRYESEGIFELQKSSSDSLDLSDMMGGAAGGASDSLSVNTDLQTQASILKSDTLELKVIKDLNLEQNPDFKQHFNPISFVLGVMSPHGTSDQAGASLENSPNRREWLLRQFNRFLSVKVEAGTRLIHVSFSNRDPKVAAAVVNHLIQGLIDYTFQTKYQATALVSNWLEGQLDDLRKQSEDLQAQVVKLQQASGIFGVGGTDLEGKPVVYSPVLDRLEQSSTLYTQAKMNTVLKGSVYQVAKTGDPELLSQLAGTTLLSEGPQGVSMQLIQNLREQEATLSAQIGQESARYGPNYPKLIEDRSSMRSIDESLQQEITRVAARAKNDYEIALSTERGAEANFDADQTAAEKLNDKTIEYTILSKEAEESNDLYQDLLKRLKEAGIIEGLHSSNLTVVQEARAPGKPSRPNVPVLLILGVLFGIVLGGMLALLVDAIDNKILTTDDIEELNLPLLGIIPQLVAQTGSRPFLLESHNSEFSETVRHVRSALMIARIGSPPQVLLITSASPGEGKSTISVNLATALAQLNKDVLLVEADMRRPVLKPRLGLRVNGGLSTFLADRSSALETEPMPDVPNLHVLPAGPAPPYPSELLAAAPLEEILTEWRRRFAFIIIDSPPILPVTDAQILVRHADATVLLARAGMTSRVALQRAYNLLAPHAKNPEVQAIGILLNGISKRSAAYYGYYGSYGYKSYYGSEDHSRE